MKGLRIIDHEKIGVIIDRWLKCEATGDEAMSQISKLHGEGRKENEAANACTQKEQ